MTGGTVVQKDPFSVGPPCALQVVSSFPEHLPQLHDSLVNRRANQKSQRGSVITSAPDQPTFGASSYAVPPPALVPNLSFIDRTTSSLKGAALAAGQQSLPQSTAPSSSTHKVNEPPSEQTSTTPIVPSAQPSSVPSGAAVSSVVKGVGDAAPVKATRNGPSFQQLISAKGVAKRASNAVREGVKFSAAHHLAACIIQVGPSSVF